MKNSIKFRFRCRIRWISWIRIQPNPKSWIRSITIKGTWKFGDFGTAHFDIFRATATENYNVEQDLGFAKLKGVLNKEGTQIHRFGLGNSVEICSWISEEDLQSLKIGYDSFERPLCRFAKRKSKKGKIIWVSGRVSNFPHSRVGNSVREMREPFLKTKIIIFNRKWEMFQNAF